MNALQISLAHTLINHVFTKDVEWNEHPPDFKSVMEQSFLDENAETTDPLIETNEDDEILAHLKDINIVEHTEEILSEMVQKDNESVSAEIPRNSLEKSKPFPDEMENEGMLITDVQTPQLEDIDELEFTHFMIHIQALFQQMGEGEHIKEVASKFTPVLKEWLNVKQQTAEEKFYKLVSNYLSEDEIELMDKISELYEKRNHFSSKQIYGDNATVTRSDVAQWLTATLESQIKPHTDRIIPVINHEQMMAPKMSVVEQQAIYTNRIEHVEGVQTEIVQEITKAIQQSKFIHRGNIMQELVIVLTPDYLGTIRISLSNVEGEMMVRMITNSGFTKELLESNVHQLKHIFSPHQVQIMRDDTLIDEDLQAHQEEDASFDQEEEQEEQLDEENKQEKISIDFSTLIRQLQEEEEQLIE